MISADSSTFIDLFRGEQNAQVELLIDALKNKRLRMAPPVETELLSFPGPLGRLQTVLAHVERLPVEPGFWERTGAIRRTVRQQGFKAKLADALIAQCCIDADVPLIATDTDFRHFATHCGLKLAV